MKAKILSLQIIVLLVVSPVFAQEKSKKELKEEEMLQKQEQIATLVNSKDFIFVANYATPIGGGQVNLTSNPNYVKFNPELFDGYMPFFGTAQAGIGYSGDVGIKFRDKPDYYTIEKKKKNFQIDAGVKGVNDVYRLSLSVSFSGMSTLTILSNNRSTISYQGVIKPAWDKGK